MVRARGITPRFELFGAPPFDTTMGRVEVDLGSCCACETVPLWFHSPAPLEDLPLGALMILSAEGRGVGTCWAHAQPKGPKGRGMSCLGRWSPCARAILLTALIGPLPRLALLTSASSKCLGPHCQLPGIRARTMRVQACKNLASLM